MVVYKLGKTAKKTPIDSAALTIGNTRRIRLPHNSWMKMLIQETQTHSL